MTGQKSQLVLRLGMLPNKRELEMSPKLEYRTYTFPAIEGVIFPHTGFYIYIDGQVTKKYSSSFDGKEWRVILKEVPTSSIVAVRTKTRDEVIHAKRVGIEKKETG